MIKGFENQTAHLTREELKAVGNVVMLLKTRRGEKNAIKSGTIIKKISPYAPVKMNGARLRKIINHIRTTGKVRRLIATSNGYYIAKTIRRSSRPIFKAFAKGPPQSNTSPIACRAI